ncbi:DNA-binding protein WhiA [Ruminococcus champanellensis]|uniref:DNA-binding protein WhiA n=1 Tax=Ruminococcus champanellensis TaxID=1161942 RepID=UPI0023F3603E|nr:DNA-binding protein WhiA [Ruminococcus champanellensis]
MISFSNQVKQELCTTITDRDKAYACLYGMLLFARQLRQDEILMQSESEAFYELMPRLFRQVFGDRVQPRMETGQHGTLYSVSLTDPEQARIVLEQYHIILPERPLEMTNVVTNSLGSFTAGAFLSCGSMTDPNKEYHLEFVLPCAQLEEPFSQILLAIGVNAKTVLRKGMPVVYLKHSEQIEDLLTFMGAQQGTIDFINIEILKNVRNKANRISNCDIANINKVMLAAERQIKDILLIDERMGLDALSPDLQQMALLRMDNPELSLKELGELLDPPIGRSGVNHRLKRLQVLADSLRTQS